MPTLQLYNTRLGGRKALVRKMPTLRVVAMVFWVDHSRIRAGLGKDLPVQQGKSRSLAW